MRSDTLGLVLAAFLAVFFSAGRASAQEAHPPSHAAHPPATQRAADPYPGPPLPEGLTLEETLRRAEDPPPPSWPAPLHDDAVFSFTQLELLEYRVSDRARDEIGWDAQGWVGTDRHKFWWKSEGDLVFDGLDHGNFDVQALYATPISPYWYVQVGVRYEQTWEPGDTSERFSGVFGFQGIAPYNFDLEPTLFVTQDGDLLAQLTASYNLYLTQRLVLQPRMELNASATDVPESGLGAGLNNGRFDLRLLYEVRREFAPYVGIRYGVLFGETADRAARGGESAEDLLFVFGARVSF